MNGKIYRTEISDGVFFNSVTDNRFKLNRITVNFLSQLDGEKNAENALVPCILTKCNSDYPTFTALNNRLSALYATRLDETTGKLGDTQYVGIAVTFIDDAFALEGENITKEAVNILCRCLFAPVLENGVFSEKTIALEKQTLIDDIEAELNDKRNYARNKAMELLCKNEPARHYECGTVETAEKITPQSAYTAYRNMLEHFRIEIVCVGCNDFSDAKEELTAAFSQIKRSNVNECSSALSPLKAEVETEIEKLTVSQSKMVMGMKSSFENIPALRVMSKIYGGTTTSKLFMNVREKLSLCYYCWSRYTRSKGVMLIDCGIENENIEKAKNEILAQFEDMKSGNFSDDDIKFAKLSLENDYKTVNDSLASIYSWYLSRIYQGDLKTPEEVMKEDLAVTREDIIGAARSMSLDSVYILTASDETAKGEAE